MQLVASKCRSFHCLRRRKGRHPFKDDEMDACAATTLKGYVQSGRGGKWGVNKKEGRFQFRVPKSMGVFSSSFVVTPRRTLFSLEHSETLTPRLRGQWTGHVSKSLGWRAWGWATKLQWTRSLAYSKSTIASRVSLGQLIRCALIHSKEPTRTMSPRLSIISILQIN